MKDNGYTIDEDGNAHLKTVRIFFTQGKMAYFYATTTNVTGIMY